MIKITKDWTLFLDRDGVINHKLDNDYVKRVREFDFLPRVGKQLQHSKKYLNAL